VSVIAAPEQPQEQQPADNGGSSENHDPHHDPGPHGDAGVTP
jgi:hypothetical protein